MPAVLDQMKDAAYTSVGVNLLVSDAVVSNVRKNREELLGRLGEPGERRSRVFAEGKSFTLTATADYPSPSQPLVLARGA